MSEQWNKFVVHMELGTSIRCTNLRGDLYHLDFIDSNYIFEDDITETQKNIAITFIENKDNVIFMCKDLMFPLQEYMLSTITFKPNKKYPVFKINKIESSFKDIKPFIGNVNKCPSPCVILSDSTLPEGEKKNTQKTRLPGETGEEHRRRTGRH